MIMHTLASVLSSVIDDVFFPVLLTVWIFFVIDCLGDYYKYKKAIQNNKPEEIAKEYFNTGNLSNKSQKNIFCKVLDLWGYELKAEVFDYYSKIWTYVRDGIPLKDIKEKHIDVLDNISNVFRYFIDYAILMLSPKDAVNYFFNFVDYLLLCYRNMLPVTCKQGSPKCFYVGFYCVLIDSLNYFYGEYNKYNLESKKSNISKNEEKYDSTSAKKYMLKKIKKYNLPIVFENDLFFPASYTRDHNLEDAVVSCFEFGLSREGKAPDDINVKADSYYRGLFGKSTDTVSNKSNNKPGNEKHDTDSGDILKQAIILLSDDSNTRIPIRSLDTLKRILGEIEDKLSKDNSLSEQHSVRKMYNYYLPSLIKMISTYRYLEDENKESVLNAETIKKEIVVSMDKYQVTFKKILNSLYEKEKLDIQTDLSVLDSVMVQDGYVHDKMDMDLNKNDAENDMIVLF